MDALLWRLFCHGFTDFKKPNMNNISEFPIPFQSGSWHDRWWSPNLSYVLISINLVLLIPNIKKKTWVLTDLIMAYQLWFKVTFESPSSMEISITLPHAGAVSGMGIKKGITVIVGGGFHGKSISSSRNWREIARGLFTVATPLSLYVPICSFLMSRQH